MQKVPRKVSTWSRGGSRLHDVRHQHKHVLLVTVPGNLQSQLEILSMGQNYYEFQTCFTSKVRWAIERLD